MDGGGTRAEHSIWLVPTKEDAMVLDCVMLLSMKQEL